MIQLLLITIQIFLALYIVSTFFLVLIYYLKNTNVLNKPNSKRVSVYQENHIAIVFNNYSNENELLSQIQFLNQQEYKNYSAYFFVDGPIVQSNNYSHIRIIRPQTKKFQFLGLLNLVKNYFDETPAAVLIINSSSKISEDFLFKMNQQLLLGNQVVQCKIQVENHDEIPINYQGFAKTFFNLIDREAMQANGLSATLWNQGFMIENKLFQELNFEKYPKNVKALQADIISRSYKISYESEAKIKEIGLNQEEFISNKIRGIDHYFFNLRIGYNLLSEGIKNPNIDKIIFGFNYLRPPIYLLFISSVLLVIIDLLWLQNLPFFGWVAATGIVVSIITLFHPFRIMQILKPFTKSLKEIRSQEKVFTKKQNASYIFNNSCSTTINNN
ncbi:MAG: hypothetical protein K9H61_00635 [Bacteroidia bacterium]|nr:hypothetical protein [Bacteroidia bacterium]MCF8426266.1 hypothetical protein [Bacteroidia bacterium]MCF8445471.1 hypothetical protein [Bacteroidia bacterium]